MPIYGVLERLIGVADDNLSSNHDAQYRLKLESFYFSSLGQTRGELVIVSSPTRYSDFFFLFPSFPSFLSFFPSFFSIARLTDVIQPFLAYTG